jgi:hypothetical protein
MSHSKNPISEELLFLIREGKPVSKLSPDRNMQPNKKVVFHFADGSTHELQTESDHKTFVHWWRDTGALLRRMRKAFLS